MESSKQIVFVTSNTGKIASAQQYFKNIKLVTYDYELIEPRTDDIQEIAKSKVMQAYNIVKQPCIALDAGFFIDSLNGFPRAFVNFSLNTIGIEGIIKLMQGEKNRKCKFKECLAYYDGNEIKYFYCEHKGTIAQEIRGKDNVEKWSDLLYIFVPEYSLDNRTLAEYSIEETHNRRENIDSSIKQFAKWYESK
jgi:XTP/dITP diphosphohydrolase